MTDLEDFMMLFGPEFKAYLQHKSIDNLLQKKLDNKQNPSIHCETKGVSDDWGRFSQAQHHEH